MVKKIKLYKSFKVSKKHKNSILLIGNFDGLHLGHQKLFNLARKYKNKKNLKIGVITFDPIPKMFFNKNLNNHKISNLNQKLNYFLKFNIDFLIVKKFNKKFSKIKSFDFIKSILFKELSSKYIFVSNNFRFGNKREGDVKLLKSFENKFKYKIINPKPLTRNNKVISSTLIRALIAKGEILKANQFLNRNWSIEGKVIYGRKLGRKIGFPTCNLNIGEYVIPKLGVYAVRVYLKNKKKHLRGIANLGYRPTFNQKKLLLEVNLFNFSGNLYNKNLRVEFLKFIRKELKFKNIDQLKKQIKLDLKIAKQFR